MNLARTCQSIVAVSASAGLVVFRADALGAAQSLRHPRDWLLAAGGDGVAAQLAAAALWCVCAWLAVAVLVTLLVQLPGAAGAAARRATEVLLPTALRGLLGVGVGTGLALAGASAAQAAPVPATQPHAAQVSLPAPAAPTHRLGTLPAPPGLPGSLSSPPHTYAVRPGDSLWSIAARHDPGASDAQLTERLQSWYAANRRVIGTDPARILPGQELRIPDVAHEGGTR